MAVLADANAAAPVLAGYVIVLLVVILTMALVIASERIKRQRIAARMRRLKNSLQPLSPEEPLIDQLQRLSDMIVEADEKSRND